MFFTTTIYNISRQNAEHPGRNACESVEQVLKDLGLGALATLLSIFPFPCLGQETEHHVAPDVVPEMSMFAFGVMGWWTS